jgi:DNA modification methylase
MESPMSRRTPAANTLFYGDNLRILRDYIEDESVDLIYLDPPFNSNASYNVLFKAPDGHDSQAQIEAFDDTWHWNTSAESAFDEVMTSGNSDAAEMLRAMRGFLGTNDMMAYLAMMAVRLIELHRVLKPTGSLYLHCDPTASHYLKILLDAVFGPSNYSNEISWKRTTAKADYQQGAIHFPRVRDVIFRYWKNEKKGSVYNQPFKKYDDEYVRDKYRLRDPDGRHYQLDNLTGPGGAAKGNAYYEVMGVSRYWRYSKAKMNALIEAGRIIQPSPGAVPRYKRYLDEMPGLPVGDDWDDIPPINSQAQERLGYPTQKPVALLERIIAASSNEGDLVLDPFCGCGTTVHAAQKLKRRWLGIDVTHLAIGLIKRRLTEAFPAVKFDVVGEPEDVDGARELAAKDKYEFQKWALASLGAQPYKGGRKGGDGGVDGFIYFKPDGKRTEKAIVSVKGGASLTPAMVKDLMVTVDQEGAKMGVFLTLEPPTKGMVAQAAAAGFYKTEFGEYPKVQIVTVSQLFQPGNPLQMPWQDTSVFKKAKREETDSQGALEL